MHAKCNWDQCVTSVTHLGTISTLTLASLSKNVCFLLTILRSSCAHPDLSTSNEHKNDQGTETKGQQSHFFAHPLIHASKAIPESVSTNTSLASTKPKSTVDSNTTVVASHAFISRSKSMATSLPTDHNIGGDTTENIGACRSICDNKG